MILIQGTNGVHWRNDPAHRRGDTMSDDTVKLDLETERYLAASVSIL